MKILSINISEPKKIVFNGKELITSIYKKPIDKSVELTDFGIVGDQQADLKVHGGYDKAVYAYSYKHYKMWSKKLNKEFNDYGLVGENLTIDDFDEELINIGDEFSISDCILKVTQPRVPCYKLGIKMNDRDFPKNFSQSGRTGAYMKVLKNGKINPNDSLNMIKKEDNSMSVYEVAKLLYTDINNIDKMKSAIELKTLTEEIKEKFRERLIKLGEFV
ncbi:MAG: MOSC domain-containing protein [Gammaproteobacteria bacterium]|nr:MOSC domain-containing protein [Gammaproteobacteria bacterium]|tara:strand:+ start:644 stop:1297 length:654 start_codon:yes stop_codon:yes gene_type:complete